jgi:DNA-binding transcriptional regulator YdaS (Cro superfamily)
MTDAKLERAPLDLAIKKAGGLRALARSLGITHRAIRQWDYVPAKYIIEIERATGIPRNVLRPDFYQGWAPVDAVSKP